MKICTIGLGYIGLPTSTIFAKYGAEVVGVDINEEVITTLNAGAVHISEPGLEELVKEVVEKGAFRASLKPEEADVFIIAVPTPNKDDPYKSCDLSYVLQAVQTILPYVRKGNTIIVESTIAPRSMDDQVKPLVEKEGFVVGEDVFLVHCPERVLPGRILTELIYNNRIVGGVTPACAEAGERVYRLFVQGEIMKTDAKTAEMSKLMENTFRDVNIALANELAKVCNDLGINVLDVIQMANKHPRVNIHQPGPGVGGHCLAVDPYFIVAESPDLTGIIQEARNTNVSMPHYVVNHVKNLVKGIDYPKIAVFGATYKGNIDDMRESPAMDVIELLEKESMNIAVYDPFVEQTDEKFMTLEEAVSGAHLILLLTDHNEFKEVNYDAFTEKMKQALVFDTRNCIKKEACKKMKLVNFGNVHKMNSRGKGLA
ncbi:nucleotide sugar dehydrogenase [Priestia taiwanensis]|uniref:UDP-N-acetyl-D-mannosamine dehydrogenase n=1 Tax=Priestia taiwanensis TaxID=1347902 RepID=A0A917EM87_9BACI|nr:nucleotide sugar dehydrogenase [Priestia taiwanensis]MBM7361602.1 UDP-N-acetyl-D-mannosaminuronic acid dehydrogenase [Priestia taiwanensis]GGE55423.1 UDP-N-acetyl-D-mannosamine dehydrogenase [Priestia taiwanensis]